MKISNNKYKHYVKWKNIQNLIKIYLYEGKYVL